MKTFADMGGEAFLLRRYANENDKNWSAFNPSVQRDFNGDYWIVFRSSNYYFTPNRDILFFTENAIRNRMFLAKLDPYDWSIDESTLKELDILSFKPNLRRGIEDARLFWDGSYWCISTTMLEKDMPLARICVGRLKSLEDPVIIEHKVMPASSPNAIEKNWMPVHKVDSLKTNSIDFMYSSKKLVSGNKFVDIENQPQLGDAFRGGSQILPLTKKTSIALIHETDYIIKNGYFSTTFSSTRSMKFYFHRFIVLDEKFQIKQYTERFVFTKPGIEFACGLAPTEGGFLVSFGRSDVATYLGLISKHDLDLHLKLI